MTPNPDLGVRNDSDAASTPLEAAFARLRKWSGEISIGRFEKPVYKNPGELKTDVRLVLDELVKARVSTTAAVDSAPTGGLESWDF